MNAELAGRAARLVFVNRYFFPDQSATSRLLSDLTFRLAGRGIAVVVVTSQQLYGDPRAALEPHEVISGVEIHRLPTATLGRARLLGRALDYASFHYAAAKQLLQLLKAGDVVVAKTDPPLISITVAETAKRREAILVNWLQDLFPEVAQALTAGLLPRPLGRALAAARDRSLRQAAMNVVLSPGMAARVLARGIDHERLRIIPNWADVTSIVPVPPEQSQTRQRLGLADRFVVGYSGNLGRAHEFGTFLDAARALRDDASIVFLITGGGARAEALRRQVEKEQLGNFIFQGYQPPELLADSLAAADVHLVSLLPALEGLIVPSKIYGILAAGRPAVVIGDPEGDLGHLVSSNGCGVAVGVGESARLADELRALHEHRERRASMGESARQLALSYFTSEHSVADWLKMLEAIAPAVLGALSPTVDGVAPGAGTAD
jgi:glycosyltransferase involved in cell wall biosynthesis